jgi:hypothetical protein
MRLARLFTSLALISTSTATAFAQDLVPDALSKMQDQSERRTIERAFEYRNWSQDGNRLCGVGRLQTDNGAGTLLVVSIEENGRYCNSIAIIRSVPRPEVIEHLTPTGGADRLDSLLRDLDNDGVPEPVFEEQYFGASECQAVFPVVYKCDMNGCSEQGRHFPDLLVSELDKVRDRIAALSSSSGADIWCLIIQRDKILRLLGRDKLAGLALARQWVQSADRDTRDKAALVASDIDDPAATELLERLQNDRSQPVADRARRGLGARKKR